VLLAVVRYVIPIVVPGTFVYGMIGGVVGFLAIVGWWVFFSRAAWSDRLGAIGLMIVAVAAAALVAHRSIRGGMMGMMLPVYSIPILGIALVAWAAATRGLSDSLRRASMVATILLAGGTLTLFRTDGVTGDDGSQLAWRRTPTPEERLLAEGGDKPIAFAPNGPATVPTGPSTAEIPKEPLATKTAAATLPAPAAKAATPPSVAPGNGPDWPGFRGPARDGIVRGARIETDWSRTPPVQLWRRPIGPGWSSFAVRGDLVYTQEQRGDDEIVSCYRLTTGEPVWKHGDAVRFYESNGGAGPRGTPTLRNSRVYTFGATGIVNALDAGNGTVLWSRNASSDTGKRAPDWGFASSPLAVDDLVIVAVAGQLIAYDSATGAQRWMGQAGGGGYSSPHFGTIDGVPQILLVRGARTMGVAPADGALLWEHSWEPAVAIVQPALIPDDGVLIGLGDAMGGMGMRRLAVAKGSAGWTVEERWTSRGLKPYYNDFVIHKGHAFGFDGSILASIDLNDGTRKWKGGRYGHGQLLLLPDQDVLLVLSEEGEVALVKATPDQFTELARFKVIEGKTWNHPVLINDVLLVRNGEEMAAFRLPVASR
nr:PQQ-binding-like beta-propeller repeat protein [Acidobacteriota bacterium]